mmetsp:Transcript_134129/g.246137  ORF Transcript_134129/g.246137 Transcript_134129/m.246137 type:complete len:104 (-) Transcript_134129:532-843(-)
MGEPMEPRPASMLRCRTAAEAEVGRLMGVRGRPGSGELLLGTGLEPRAACRRAFCAPWTELAALVAGPTPRAATLDMERRSARGVPLDAPRRPEGPVCVLHSP